jgi:hypothetical protein
VTEEVLEPDGTDVSLTDLLEQVMERALQSMTGPMIGKVDTYDAAAGRVSITPLIPLSVDDEIVPAPKLPSVPVLWPRSGTHAVTFPLAAGALMELVPLGHDHSRWMVAGTEGQQPTDDRRFSLSDLVALPLAPSPLSAPPDPTSYDSAWGVLFGQWKAGDSTASDFVALATKVLTELQSIKTAYDLHTHSYNPGPAPAILTTVPSNRLPAPGSVACTKLQAK